MIPAPVLNRAMNMPLMSSLILTLSFSFACTHGLKGEYADPTEVEVLDDKWNETDARRTAEEMVKSSLGSGWLNDYTKGNDNRRPIVVVADVENRTDEHIDTQALSEDIRNALINSRKVRYVNKGQREAILKEIEYQNSGAVNKQQAKQTGKQIAADYLLHGSISSIVSSEGNRKNVTYQVELSLTNLETAEVEWTEVHKRKKRFKRSGWGL